MKFHLVYIVEEHGIYKGIWLCCLRLHRGFSFIRNLYVMDLCQPTFHGSSRKNAVICRLLQFHKIEVTPLLVWSSWLHFSIYICCSARELPPPRGRAMGAANAPSWAVLWERILRTWSISRARKKERQDTKITERQKWNANANVSLAQKTIHLQT